MCQEIGIMQQKRYRKGIVLEHYKAYFAVLQFTGKLQNTASMNNNQSMVINAM